MNDPADLGAFLALAWDRLERAVYASGAATRYVSFATVSAAGRPEVRTVALRATDRVASRVEIHTDPTTAKVTSLQQTPFAEIALWDPEPMLQIRLSVAVDVRTGAQVAEAWDRVPAASRSSYGTQPVPGAVIDGPFAYEKPGLAEGFAILNCRIETMDVVELQARHRRALFCANDGWAGTWVSP